MDSARLSDTRARLVRLRWRRAGAWLWPSFIAFTLADAVIGHNLPPAGSTESLTAAGLLGLVLNLLAVLFLSRPLGWALRRRLIERGIEAQARNHSHLPAQCREQFEGGKTAVSDDDHLARKIDGR